MAEKKAGEVMAEEISVFLETVDKNNNPITLYTTTGKGATISQFGKALSEYDSTDGKSAGEGFVAAPPGFGSSVRKGLALTGEGIRENVPKAAEAVGGVAGTSPLLILASKLGLISPATANAPIAAGRATGSTIGETVAPIAADMVSTPRSAGMTAGIAAAAPFMAPAYATGAAGTTAFRALPMVSNMAKTALMGAGGAELGALSTGESFNPGQAVEELAIGALSGGLSSVIGYTLAKFMPSQGEKVASAIAKELYDAYPALKGDPQLMQMIGSRQIERITQRMSTGLQGELDDATTALLNNIKNTLPRNLSVGQQATLRAHTRHVVDSHTKLLDAAGDPAKLTKAAEAVDTAKQGLIDFFRGNAEKGIKPAYPGINNIEPTALRVESTLADYMTSLEQFNTGMKVINAMRQAGANEQWNPMQFAQLIRGTYQEPGNPLMTRIGEILGGEQSLTALPMPGQRQPGTEGGRAAYNLLKEFIPGPVGKILPNAAYKGPSVPWTPEPSPLQRLYPGMTVPTGAGPLRRQLATGTTKVIQGMPDVAVQESGAEAMKSFQRSER